MKQNKITGFKNVVGKLNKIHSDYINSGLVSKETADAMNLISTFLNRARSFSLDIEVTSFDPCAYYKYSNSWIQPTPAQHPPNPSPVLKIKLTNNSSETFDGRIKAFLKERGSVPTDPVTSLMGVSTQDTVTGLKPGETHLCDLWFYGMAQGLYDMSVQFLIDDPNPLLTFTVYDFGTGKFNTKGGSIVATEKNMTYISGDRGFINSTIISLLGISVIRDTNGNISAEATDASGTKRALKTTTAINDSLILSQVTYKEQKPDGTDGLIFKVQLQVLTTYSEKNSGTNNRDVVSPSISMAITSNKHDKSLFFTLTPNSPYFENYCYIRGNSRAPKVDTGGVLRLYQTQISGNLKLDGTYIPDPGISNFTFDMISNFAEEIDALSFYSSVLNENMDDLMTDFPQTLARLTTVKKRNVTKVKAKKNTALVFRKEKFIFRTLYAPSGHTPTDNEIRWTKAMIVGLLTTARVVTC